MGNTCRFSCSVEFNVVKPSENAYNQQQQQRRAGGPPEHSNGASESLTTYASDLTPAIYLANRNNGLDQSMSSLQSGSIQSQSLVHHPHQNQQHSVYSNSLGSMPSPLKQQLPLYNPHALYNNSNSSDNNLSQANLSHTSENQHSSEHSDDAPTPEEAVAIAVTHYALEQTKKRNWAAYAAFLSTDCTYLVEGHDEVPANRFIESFRDVVMSFPDISIEWESIQLARRQPHLSNDTIVVEVVNFMASGHHTGTPFAFETSPAVEPKGKYAEDGPFLYTVHVTDGRISKIYFSGAEVVGPEKLYLEIGGIIM